jgi:hypothetical protein
MRYFPLLPLVSFIFLAFSAPAFAVTVDEVVDMAEAGVSGDVILALIEATDSSFDLSADEIVMLKEAGLNDEIIVAMIGKMDNSEKDIGQGDIYLQLTDEQFRRLYLKEERVAVESPQVYNQPVREPEYYYSGSSKYSQGYISHPSHGTSSYNPGLTETYYHYVYPGIHKYGYKYYRPVSYYYYGTPAYYVFDNYAYYPGHYVRYYDPYPIYYKVHHPHRHYRYYHPYSRGHVKYTDDDWYFSLGFSF